MEKEPAPYCRSRLDGEGEGESLQGPAKRTGLLPPPPNACLTSEYFTEMAAWMARKEQIAKDIERYSNGEIIVNHLDEGQTNSSDDNVHTTGAAPWSARDNLVTLSTVLTGTAPGPAEPEASPIALSTSDFSVLADSPDLHNLGGLSTESDEPPISPHEDPERCNNLGTRRNLGIRVGR